MKLIKLANPWGFEVWFHGDVVKVMMIHIGMMCLLFLDLNFSHHLHNLLVGGNEELSTWPMGGMVARCLVETMIVL